MTDAKPGALGRHCPRCHPMCQCCEDLFPSGGCPGLPSAAQPVAWQCRRPGCGHERTPCQILAVRREHLCGHETGEVVPLYAQPAPVCRDCGVTFKVDGLCTDCTGDPPQPHTCGDPECPTRIDHQPVPDVAGWIRAKAKAVSGKWGWLADAWEREHQAALVEPLKHCTLFACPDSEHYHLGPMADMAALLREKERREQAARDVAGRASDGSDQPLSAAGRGAVVDEPCSTPPHTTGMPPDEPSRGDRAVQATTPAAAPPHASAGEKEGESQ